PRRLPRWDDIETYLLSDLSIYLSNSAQHPARARRLNHRPPTPATSETQPSQHRGTRVRSSAGALGGGGPTPLGDLGRKEHLGQANQLRVHRQRRNQPRWVGPPPRPPCPRHPLPRGARPGRWPPNRPTGP